MANQTVTLHRIIKARPEKVFKAFSDPVAHASWLPPYGFICTVQEMDFRVGGNFKMTFINFGTGNEQPFSGTFLEIVPHQFIKYADHFDDPQLSGEIITSIRFKEVRCGTDIHVTQEGIPEVIPAEMCYLGWQDSLEKLMNLVEPTIPDAS